MADTSPPVGRKRGPGAWARLRRAAWALAAAAVVGACSVGPSPDRVLVFAAASLLDAIEEIRPAFEEMEGIEVAVSYGGSHMLARQIAEGAPADLFVSAGEAPVRLLEESGAAEGGAVPLASNDLVVVARPGAAPLESIENLASGLVGRVAVADPELAPAGQYAREALISLGLWEAMADKVVTAPDVRASLSYVEAGNADAALVYRTDAMTAPGLRMLDIVPPDSYSTVVYPAVLVRGSDGRDGAELFLRHLRSAAFGEALARRGFLPAPPPAGE